MTERCERMSERRSKWPGTLCVDFIIILPTVHRGLNQRRGRERELKPAGVEREISWTKETRIKKKHFPKRIEFLRQSLRIENEFKRTNKARHFRCKHAPT